MKVFISYSFKDKDEFDDVCFAFERNDIPLWTSGEIVAGQALPEKLRSAIENCVACVFIATQNSLASTWCQAEIGAFWGAAKPVVMYLRDDKLNNEDLPKQFQHDKRAATTREVVDAVKVYLREAAESTLINKLPANVFWLGHDLARAIRFAMFEPNKRTELDAQLRQALHHLDEIELPAPDARKLLLSVLKRHRGSTILSEEEGNKFGVDIAIAKNEIGDRIEHLQPGFKGYPTIEAQKRLDHEVESFVNSDQ